MLSSLNQLWRDYGLAAEPLREEIAAATGWLTLNPALYGARWHEERLRAYPLQRGGLMIVGLNPGPYGMVQTGVPFTDLVRLESHLPQLTTRLRAAGIWADRPGLAPAEVRPHLKLTWERSSWLIYTFLELAYGSAERALTQVFAINSSPLFLLDAAAASQPNRTPADILRQLRRNPAMDAVACRALVARLDDQRTVWLSKAAELLQPKAIILLGKNVQESIGARLAGELNATGLSPAMIDWPHPARANTTWAVGLRDELAARGLVDQAASGGRHQSTDEA